MFAKLDRNGTREDVRLFTVECSDELREDEQRRIIDTIRNENNLDVRIFTFVHVKSASHQLDSR